MRQPEDLYTLGLPLPVSDASQAAVQPLPDDIEYGDVARSLGLPPAAPKVPALPAWRVALDAAIAGDPAGKKGVAERLTEAGFKTSRPYVSRIATGHIPKASAKFIAKVVAVYLRVDCPALQRSLPPAECRAYAERSYAQITSFEVAHWRACRGCANNPGQPATQPAAPVAARRARARKAAAGAGAAGTTTATAAATPATTATTAAPATAPTPATQGAPA